MLPRVYFLRHGLADSSAWHGPDFERPLTPRGIERMHSEGRALAALGLGVSLILTSPLKRARQTAAIAAEFLGLPLHVERRLAPGFGPAALEGILKAYPQAAALLLVGHEPDFSLTIGALIGGGRVVCKKGSLARVDLYALHPPRGELVWLLPPKVLLR